jgi:hypothetical protein
MKKIYTILLTLAIAGCTPEKIQEKAEDLVIQAMTTGEWTVTNYTRGGTDVTADFSPYKFQFKNNNTVDAVNGGAVEQTGAWNADGTARTITSSFTSGATLMLLNGTWNITSTTWTSVNATQTVNGETRVLKLNKL